MKLHFSGTLPVLWIFLLTMKLVSCQPLDSNESSEIEQPATCPGKIHTSQSSFNVSELFCNFVTLWNSLEFLENLNQIFVHCI